MTRRGSHAIVLGASMAGLVHAVPLSRRFDRVTLVDRDLLPTEPRQRRGVPQGEHVHLFVPGGLTRLEQLLPGVMDDLVAHGADLIAAPEWRFHMGGGRVAVTDPDLRITGATRPLLEGAVRERVLGLDGVELADGWAARELTATADGGRITGVRLRSAREPGQERTLDADLVVDTMGRGSPSPRWLAALGHTPPEEQRLTVDVHYTTRLFRRDPTTLGGCRNVLVDIPPGERRGGVALAVEDDRWLVTLIGMLGERPPTDLAGFTAYAASLWNGDLHTLVDGATPVGDAATHAFPAFAWHRYDRLRRLPQGYAVSGDAVCSLDPRFGQGMTVAMAEAIELGRTLDRHGLDRVGERLLAAARPTVQDAWELATGSDLAHPEVDGPRPWSWRMTSAYLQRLLPAAHRDPTVAAAFVRTIGMLDRPQQLMHPRILRRVLGRGGASAAGGRVPAATSISSGAAGRS